MFLSSCGSGSSASSSTSTEYGCTFSGSSQRNGESVLAWMKQFGESGVVNAKGVNVDQNGNVYIVGKTNVGLFGESQFGANDYFIVKYDKSGDFQWVRQLGGIKNTGSAGNSAGEGIRVDNFGNLYIVGYTDVSLFGQLQNGLTDYFIAKYNENGDLLWGKQVGSPGGDTKGSAIDIDKSCNIYITGNTNRGISGESRQGDIDYFVAKYNGAGNLKWTREVGASNGDAEGKGISVDQYGASYIVGFTNVGISGESKHGEYDYFVAKYDEAGNLKWTKEVGGEGSDVALGYGISIDKNNGKIYIVGQTDFGMSGESQIGFHSYFISRHNESGNLQWTRIVGAPFGRTVGYGVSAIDDNNIYITGQTDVGISGESQVGETDYFVAKYDQLGAIKWSYQYGIAGEYLNGNAISADNNGNSYVVGDVDLVGNGVQVGYFISKYH